MATKIYKHEGGLVLESGERLPELTIAYNTYGTLNAAGDNAVWVCHALTANSDVADWWPHTVEEGRFLDPAKHFVVCANILGSHYGTTGPLHVNPGTGEAWYGDFPAYTIRDMVAAHVILARHLGVRRLRALIGSSVGGYQAVEWAVAQPEFVEKLVLIATGAISMPWMIAVGETQRMAIRADGTFGERRPDAGMAGMAAARAIGLLTYRGVEGYNLTQRELDDPEKTVGFRAASYQRYQGEKLCRRYNAYSYYHILNAFDTHNVGRGRGGVDAALAAITAHTLLVAIEGDIVFPPEDLHFMQARIRGAELHTLTSAFGHDGFLVEHEKLNEILLPFVNGN
jgi:homoserine O-acetyltransferase